MNLRLFSNSLAALCLILPARAESEFQCAHCLVLAKFAAAEAAGGNPRKYAPDRLVDIHHLLLEVTPNFEQRTIEATATLDFQPIAQPLPHLSLNAVGLTVHEAKASHAIQAKEVTDDKIHLHFQTPIPAGEKAQVVIRYSVEPTEGLYFRTEKMGYPKGDTQLWTQGEPESHRHWFPSHDYPNEKFTTEVICHVPEGMMALSNGRLLSEKKEKPGLTTFHWLQDKPHVNYLISLVAGYFEKMEDKLRDIPIAIYVPPSEKAQAKNSFRDTKKILEYFEKEIGVPYPWDKYYNVCAIDYMMGGMENTSITTLTVRTLFPDAVENLHSSRGLDAHEAAHQWFGDLVTCKDWSHLWLNEGFATYYSSLYEGEAEGADAFKLDMYEKAQTITANANDTIPIVYKEYAAPMEQFSFRAYPKGAWVLHMLRARLGADLFRQGIKTYLERHRFGTVVTQDLQEILEEISGRSLGQFFDQWVYLSGTPELEVKYTWIEQTKQAKISVTQKQTVNEKRPYFRFALPIRFIRGEKQWDVSAEIHDQTEDFYFTVEEAPEIMRIDPDVTVLAKIQFEPPKPMLLAQLAHPKDALGRMIAAKQLAGQKNQEAVAALQKVLAEDSFFATRVEVANGLASMQTPEALQALTRSLAQGDARAREAVVGAIARFYDTEAAAALGQLANQEVNPEIRAQAIRAVARYTKPELRAMLLREMQSDSYHHQIAGAAIEGMRTQDDPFYIEPVLRELQQNEQKFSSDGFASGLRALAHLARNETDKAGVRAFLIQQVDHAKDRVAEAAIGALGNLQDAKALPVLETIASSNGKSAKVTNAREAANRLRAAKPLAPEEVAALRNQVSDLQRQIKNVSEELRATKARFEEAIGALRKAEKDGKKPSP